MNTLTMLLMMHILRSMPARCVSLICCAGSLGYHALKEMLLSGVPGNTLLIESEDLLTLLGTNMDDDGSDETLVLPHPCSLVYTFHPIPWEEVNNSDGSEDADDYDDDDDDDKIPPPAYKDHVPPSATHVVVYTDMTEIPEYFLDGCTGLTSIDFSPSSHVTKIQEHFLSDCTNLQSLDLWPFSQVTEVSCFFLENCTSLLTIDLSPLSHLTELSVWFLGGSGITSIDLSPLSNVRVLWYGALTSCRGLRTIDLSPLSELVEMHDGFLEGSVGLPVIDLSMMSKLNSVPISLSCPGRTPLVLPDHLKE